MIDREQLYEGFEKGVLSLGDIIDISQKDGYNKALEDFAEQFKAHCRKFTTKSISESDIDWVKNELKK